MEPEETRHFDLLDYAFFGGMLSLSALIGVYFAFCAKEKQNTTNEYLMGGKNMGIFPISMSLIASYISGISLLGLPAEMYTYGTQLSVVVLSDSLVSVTMALVYLPIFYKLQITSSYEYLKMRFNKKVQILGCVIFLIKMLFYIPIVIYVPALAFSQVTGFNLHLISPLVCLVCIFYTTLGGLRAVVWTDTLQTILMVGGIIFVLVYGTIKVGGVGKVWEISAQGDRLEFFNMDPNPLLRHTFWTVCAGNYFNWLAACSVNQAMVQRCLAMRSLKRAIITVAILAVGISTIVALCCFTGLVIYSTFHDCDPLSTGAISKNDQLLPYYVMAIAGNIPALPGIFLSGVFSAALSTMSTGLNSMSGVIFEDLINPLFKRKFTEAKASLIMKIIVCIIGFVCVTLVFLVEQMGMIIQAGKSLSGITAGSLLGLFTMGMFLPWVNSTGALVGGISATLFVGWISFGTQSAMRERAIVFPVKAISIQGCKADPETLKLYNQTLNNIISFPSSNERPDVNAVYTISYLYYTAIGFFLSILIGILVSLASGKNDTRKVNRDLISPIVHRWLSKVTDHQEQTQHSQIAVNGSRKNDDGIAVAIIELQKTITK